MCPIIREFTQNQGRLQHFNATATVLLHLGKEYIRNRYSNLNITMWWRMMHPMSVTYRRHKELHSVQCKANTRPLNADHPNFILVLHLFLMLHEANV